MRSIVYASLFVALSICRVVHVSYTHSHSEVFREISCVLIVTQCWNGYKSTSGLDTNQHKRDTNRLNLSTKCLITKRLVIVSCDGWLTNVWRNTFFSRLQDVDFWHLCWIKLFLIHVFSKGNLKNAENSFLTCWNTSCKWQVSTQAAQAPAVRWSSCEIRVMAKL